MHTQTTLYLDNEYNIQPDSWIVIEKPKPSEPLITQLSDVATPSIAAYGLSGKTTRLDFKTRTEWLSSNDQFSTIRGTVIYAQSEALTLAEAPIGYVVGAKLNQGSSEATSEPNRIELNGLYEGLESGRWVIVSGERADLPG